jgi:hypothetical protein
MTRYAVAFDLKSGEMDKVLSPHKLRKCTRRYVKLPLRRDFQFTLNSLFFALKPGRIR